MPTGPVSVSVVVIGHRPGEALASAVRSVAAQGHRPLELVLFGNGAPLAVPEPLPADCPVRTSSSPSNLGVAGGRNAAARLATGDALLFLDDDAVLHPDTIAHAVTALEAGEDVGAVAFNVVAPATGQPVLWMGHPHPVTHSGHRFDTLSFIGCGNLVRRSAFEALDGFWDGYFREMEEIDFSWRLVDAGWRIRYEPSAVVEHPERTEAHFAHSIASNLLLVWRLMPLPAAARQTAYLVALFTARGARPGRLRQLASGLGHALRLAPRARRERATLSAGTVRRLRRTHAPQGVGKRLRWSLRPMTTHPSPSR